MTDEERAKAVADCIRETLGDLRAKPAPKQGVMRAHLAPLLENYAWRKLEELRALGWYKLEGEIVYEGEEAHVRIKAIAPVPIHFITLKCEIGTMVDDDG